jgi:2-amino-4-hydroxy-6-hydroxymethyldihydropteridine diphosphokinase
MPAYVALGSNLDDPPRRSQPRSTARGSRWLSTDRALAAVSNRAARTAGSAEFVNAAAGLLTRARAARVVASVDRASRPSSARAQPAVRWGPRRIDLDLLLLDDVRMAEPD